LENDGKRTGGNGPSEDPVRFKTEPLRMPTVLAQVYLVERPPPWQMLLLVRADGSHRGNNSSLRSNGGLADTILLLRRKLSLAVRRAAILSRPRTHAARRLMLVLLVQLRRREGTEAIKSSRDEHPAVIQ